LSRAFLGTNDLISSPQGVAKKQPHSDYLPGVWPNPLGMS
jgi:hypothetical protein